MRCLSVLDLVILFYLFIFSLGREAQKVREWGDNSLIRFFRYLPPYGGVGHSSKGPRMGRNSLKTFYLGCRFFGDSFFQCGVCPDLVILFYLFIFFLGRELKRSANGASIL